MAGNYRYLDFEDRKKIEAWHARGDRPLEIAARLGVHTATIYHELQRGYTCLLYTSFPSCKPGALCTSHKSRWLHGSS